MRITLDIDDPQYETFLAFIKTLDYVSIPEEAAIPDGQQEETARRLKQVAIGEVTVRSWAEAKEDIFK